MTSPTLELHLKASGVAEVKALREALALLNGEVGRLKDASKGLSALGEIQAQLKAMRDDLKSGFGDLKKALTDGVRTSFAAATKEVAAGGKDLRKAFDDQMRDISKGIADRNTEIAKKLTEANGSVSKAATAAGQKTAQDYSKGLQEGVAKMRVSLPSLALGGGASVSVSTSSIEGLKQAEAMLANLRTNQRAQGEIFAQDRTMMDQAVRQYRALQDQQLVDQLAFQDKQKAQWLAHEAERAKRLQGELRMMDGAVAQYRRLQAEQLADQISFEAKQKELWRANSVALAAQMRSELTMMDQAVRQYRALQDAKLTATARAQTARATGQAAAPYSTLSTGKLVDIPAEAEGRLASITRGLSLFTGQAGDAHSAARGLASGFGLLWLTWGSMIPLLAGAALSNSVSQMIHLGAETQHTFEIIRVLSEESSQSVGKLNVQMLDLARNGPVGPRELAEAMKTLSLAGLSAAEVSSSIKDVLNFAVAGTTSIQNAADVLTSVATAFHISADNYNYVGDVISKTAAASKASVESIGSAFKTASVINSQYGASLEDVGVGLALLANLGIQGTAAGTALRNMYVDILGRTPKVRTALKELMGDADFAFDKTTGKAKSLVSIFEQMGPALAKFKPVDQFRLLQDIFSERGGKGAEAIRDALTKGVDEAGRILPSKLEQIKKQIDESAGFMAIAAANLALTPLNQMKSVVSTLQATLAESFSAVEPSILAVSQRLKDAFNSDEFKNAIQKIGLAIGALTAGLTEHLTFVTAVGSAYLGLKAVGLLTSLYAGFTAKVLLSTEALLGEAAATQMAAASKVAYAGKSAEATAATAAIGFAASGTAGKIAGMVGTGLSLIGKLLPWVTALWAAWELYSFWTEKADVSNAKLAGNTTNSLIKALNAEADRLHEINEAKSLGISLDELKNRKAVTQAQSAPNLDLSKAELKLDELRDLQKRMPASLDNSSKKAAEALAQQVLAQEKEVQTQRGLAEAQRINLAMSESRVKYESAIGKEMVKQEAAARAMSVPSGDQTRTPTGKKGRTTLGADSDAATLEAELRIREGVLKNAYDNERQILESAHKNRLISEGTFEAKMLQQETAYEAQRRQAIQDTDAASLAEYRERTALARSKLTGEALQQELEKLKNHYVKFGEQTAASLAKVDEDAKKRTAVAIQNAQGAVIKLSKENDLYWAKAEAGTKKEADLAKVRRDLANATEEVRARAEAEIKVEDTHAVQIEKLQQEYNLAKTAVEDFITAFEGGQPVTEEAATAYNAMTDRLKAATTELQKAAEELRKLKGLAGDAAVNEVQNKSVEKLRSDAKELSKTLASGLADAVLTGGKQGIAKLKDIAKQAFLSPIKVLLQGVFMPMTNSLVNAGYSLLGLNNATGGSNPMGSSLLSSMMGKFTDSMGLTGPGGLTDKLMGQFGYGSGLSGSAVTSAEIEATVSSTSEALTSLGASAEEATAASQALGQSMGSASSSLSVLGPFAAVLAVFAAAYGDGFFSGEKRTGGTYGYSFDGTQVRNSRTGVYQSASAVGTQFLEGPSGGEGDGGVTKATIDAMVFGINDALKTLGSDLTLTGFQAGWETSKSGRGGVFSGGTLSNGKTFGDLGAGSNYENNKTPFNSPYELWSQLRITDDPKKVFAEFTTDLKQSALEVLQVIAGAGPQVVLKTWSELGPLQNSGESANGEIGMLDKQQWVRIFDDVALAAADAAAILPKKIWELVRGVDFESKTEAEVDAVLTKINTMLANVKGFRQAVAAMPIEALKDASFDLADTLVTLAGGVEAFNTKLTSYYQNFYSDGERALNLQNSLRVELQKLGLSLPATRAGYRALVEAQDLTTESGQKTFTALLSLAGAFASLVPAVDSVTAATKTQEELNSAVETARNALSEAYQTERSELEQTRDQMAGFAKGIKEFRDGLLLGNLSPLTPKQKYEEAASQYSSVLNAISAGPGSEGYIDALSRYDSVAQSFLEASQVYNASGSAYQSDFQRVLTDSSKAVSVAQAQYDIAQQQLTALEQMVAGILGLNEHMSVLEALTQYNSAAAAASAAPLQASLAVLSTLPALMPFGVGNTIPAMVAAITATLPGHAGGLDRVPYDNYAMRAHKDEAILTREEAKVWRGLNGGLVSDEPWRGANGASVRDDEAFRLLLEKVDRLGEAVDRQTGALLAGQAEIGDRSAAQIGNHVSEAVNGVLFDRNTAPTLK